MFQKIDNKISYKKHNLSSINQNNNTIHDSSIDYSFNNNNHSSIMKNNILTPLENNSSSRTFLNNFSTKDKNSSNKNFNTLGNYPNNHHSLKNNKIKLFDRPIYNFIFPEKNKTIENRRTLNCLSTQKESKLDDKYEQKNNFNNIFFHIKTKRKKLDSIFNNNKKNKNIEYFPKLLDFRSSSMINKKSDKYKDKNILFIKLKDLNFETEIRNISRKHFITPDKYLFINSNDKSNFVEKKTTYKILENIKFNFKSFIDKSKLQKYSKNFNSFYTINKLY